MKIGFFDSGIGGLTILNAVRGVLPEYDYLFYGDTKNVPYGDKTEEEIRTLTKSAVEYLFDRGAGLVVIACNTASAESLRKLQDTMLDGAYSDRKILGVIIPTIETIIDADSKTVLIIGTNRTVNSQKYNRELEKQNSSVKLITIATPTLVPLIEANQLQDAYDDLKTVVEDQTGEVDTVVLGCTHYTVLKNQLKSDFPKLKIISQDEVIPDKLKTYLENHPEIKLRLTKGKNLETFITGDAEQG